MATNPLDPTNTQGTNPTAPGYVNPAPQSSLINPTPAVTAAPATYNATTTQVSKPTDTVQGQLAGIIDANSPLMQQAARRAAEQANSRGLLNSSIAVNAGQEAVMNAALPIATADANTYNQTRLTNQTAENAAGQFNANVTTDTNQKNAAAQNTVQLTNMDQAFKTALANADAQSKVVLQQLGDQTKVNLDNIEADYKTLMQTSSSASDMFKSALDSISKAVADTNMNAAAKASAINGYIGWMKNGLNLVASVNGVDLGPLLNFGAVTPNG